MKVTPIDNPVSGEWLLDVKPVLAPNTDSGWSRRLNYFTGRTLSHTALIAEQQNVNGRLALMGQGVSKGIVAGLEATKSFDAQQVFIAPGSGIVITGEEVTVPRSLKINARDIQVYAPVGLLPDSDDSITPGSDTLLARALGPTLGELLDDGVAVPPVGILLLQAVAVDLKGIGEERDPCEEDVANNAFENWQVADGVRLIYYAWPSDYLTLPSRTIAETQASPENWQNRIAYQIFEKEKTVANHPWDELGVAIALVGFDESWNLQFVDRHAVARQGGKPRHRKLINDEYGSPFMWQARVDQFNAQISELSTLHSSDQSFVDEAARQAYYKETTQQISESFRHLPPVGMLPKQSLNFETWESYFFQNHYLIDVVAVPQEQLDVVLEAAAPLEPFHVDDVDKVRIAVPVPQVWYEPQLLHTEEENPAFQEAIDKFSKTRAMLLDRRQEIRAKVSALTEALTNEPKTYPTPDPDALEENESDWRFLVADSPDADWDKIDFDDGDWGLNSPLATSNSQIILCRKTIDIEDVEKFVADIGIKVDANYDIHINGIRAILSGGPSPNEESLQSLIFPPEMLNNFHDGENVIGIRIYNINDRSAPFELRLLWQYLEDAFGTNGALPYRSQSIFDFAEWLQSTGLAGSLINTYKTDASGNYIIDDKTGEFESEESHVIVNKILELISADGFDQFITNLQAMVDSADDTVNLKFLKIQSDIYRLRQLMLGDEDSSRLATSPVLASIAKGETALGTKEDLVKFYDKLKFDAGIKRSSTATTTIDSGNVAKRATTENNIKKHKALSLPINEISAGGFEFDNKVILDAKVEDTTRTDVMMTTFVPQQMLFQTQEPAPTYNWIFQQQAIIGWIPQIRTTTVAERLKSPASVEAKNAAVATKYETVQEILALSIFTDNIFLPGFREPDLDEVSYSINELRINPSIVSAILSGNHDRLVTTGPEGELVEVSSGDADEGDFYSAGVRALENASSMLRLIEARINSYRRIITKCLDVQTEVSKFIGKANARLATLAVDIAESRYDVSVAKALLEEERARVAAINERRKNILAKHVPYLAFFRPRVVDSLQDTPVRPLNPQFTVTPVPTCLNANVEVPEEIGAMLEILRDSPLKWFANADSVLNKLNKQKQQKDLLEQSKYYAAQNKISPVVNTTIGMGGSAISQALYQSMAGMYQVIAAQYQTTAQLDMSIVNQQSWKKNKQTVKDTVLLRDIIDGKHGNATIAKELSQLLNDIASIASCLYQSFSQTPAKLRLDWAERLSQYDETVSLRNLSSLPRWAEVDYLDRKKMQTYVDWLHNQIDKNEAKAVVIVNDVVRICLLLASHSPVNKIISGNIKKSKTVKPGDFFEVVINPSTVYVGMEVFVYQQNQPVLKAVVDDFVADQVSAKVVSTATPTVALVQGAVTHFSQPGKFSKKPVAGKKTYYV